MLPKEFIQVVLIDECKDIVERHAYISFAVIAIGIEFLGKCMLVNHKYWNDIKPEKAFNEGLKLLVKVDSRYGHLNLKRELRDGLAHTLLPKSKIDLVDSKHNLKHFGVNKYNQTVLVAEEFYSDFVKACKIVIEYEFAIGDKMNSDFLRLDS